MSSHIKKIVPKNFSTSKTKYTSFCINCTVNFMTVMQNKLRRVSHLNLFNDSRHNFKKKCSKFTSQANQHQ